MRTVAPKVLLLASLLLVVLFFGCTNNSTAKTESGVNPSEVIPSPQQNTTDSDTSIPNVMNTIRPDAPVPDANKTVPQPNTTTELGPNKTEEKPVLPQNTTNPTNQTEVKPVPLQNTTNPETQTPTVTICKVVYNPSTGVKSDDQLIQLCNSGNSRADIGGWQLTDGEGTYTIPAGTIIAPNSEWSVKGTTFNPTRATTKLYLAKTHDSVTLFDKNGNKIDEKQW